MSLSHELRYFHPDGTAGDLPAWSKFSLVYGLNGIGELVVTIPTKLMRSDYYRQWGICEVWREVNGIPRLEGDRVWRLQYINDGYDESRNRTIELRFLDDNNFLDSRIVESFLGTNAGTELIAADDYMKTVVSEQLDSLRANSRLTVAASTTQAAEVSRLLGYNNLYETLLDIHEASKAAVPVFFDCIRTSTTTSEFRTFYGHRGTNRGSDSGQPLVVNMESGNMSSPHLVYDWREEANFVYAFGQGDGSARASATYPTSYPDDGSTLREVAIDARDCTTDAELLQAAKIEWESRRTRPRFSCAISDTREFRYGRDYRYGDVLVAQYHNHSFDVHVRLVKMDVDESGGETLRIGVTNYE